jgi:transcriptional regulator with XRE-family HTH domain
MGRIRTITNYLELNMDQIEQLRLLRKMADISLTDIGLYMGCSASKMQRLENGNMKIDNEFYRKLIKKYESIIRCNK